ncbi:DUF4407 domain-containing protein, partial [Vibrio parahaemolyticus]
MPRIIMGAIIALTISKPVEIRMFQTEIQAELFKKKQEKLNEYRKEIESAYKPSLDNIQKQIDGLQNKINEKYQTFKEREVEWDQYTKL